MRAPFESRTPDAFDNSYYSLLLAWDDRSLERGEANFIPTDVALVLDASFRRHVVAFARSEPLFRAAASNDAAEVRRLLKDDYESDAALPDGTTPLHAAALSDSIKVAKLLLDSADDARSLIEARGAHGLTALHTAAAANALKVVAELVKRGAVVDSRHAFANSTCLLYTSPSPRDRG